MGWKFWIVLFWVPPWKEPAELGKIIRKPNLESKGAGSRAGGGWEEAIRICDLVSFCQGYLVLSIGSPSLWKMKWKHRKPGTAGETFKKEGTESWGLFSKVLRNVSESSAQEMARETFLRRLLQGGGSEWPLSHKDLSGCFSVMAKQFLWKNCLVVTEKVPVGRRGSSYWTKVRPWQLAPMGAWSEPHRTDLFIQQEDMAQDTVHKHWSAQISVKFSSLICHPTPLLFCPMFFVNTGVLFFNSLSTGVGIGSGLSDLIVQINYAVALFFSRFLSPGEGKWILYLGNIY